MNQFGDNVIVLPGSSFLVHLLIKSVNKGESPFIVELM